MESNPSTQQGGQRRAILVSGKLFNDDDGLIWPTGGRFAALWDVVMLALWSAGPRRQACLARKRGKPVKWPRIGRNCSRHLADTGRFSVRHFRTFS
jgi:hypothetical protein